MTEARAVGTMGHSSHASGMKHVALASQNIMAWGKTQARAHVADTEYLNAYAHREATTQDLCLLAVV